MVTMQDLQIGQTVYVDHDKCGDTKRRLGYTKVDKDKILFNCFNCGHKGITNHRRLAGKKFKDFAKPKFATIPDDAEFNPAFWPPAARKWVGDLLPEAVKHKFFYSPYDDRLVVPYFDNDGILWANMRALNKDQEPKYLLRKAERMGLERPFYLNNWEAGRTLVLTEDCLSALKVSRLAGVTGAACMGTKLSKGNLAKVKYLQPTEVFIFFDNDNADVKKSQVQLKKQLDLALQCPVQIIRSDKDPKEHTEGELKCLIGCS